jgi:hypothetical protein
MIAYFWYESLPQLNEENPSQLNVNYKEVSDIMIICINPVAICFVNSALT